MLSISPPMCGGGSANYYLGLAREDYYLEGGEPPGHWFGAGAERFGLAGEVGREALHNLLEGHSPDGVLALVQNAGDGKRQSGWDLTFSAPKSVSVAWSQATPELRQLIQRAHFEAVTAALTYLEAVAGFTRRGKAGTLVEKANLVIALFEHGTSRAQDPQLHTHALVLNIALRADGSTGTLQSIDLFRHKMAAGALYRAELAAQLERNLGLQSERVLDWFELKGVSKKLIETFSQRRAEIERAMAERGVEGAVAAKVAALDTRQWKEHVARSELFAQWQAVGREFGWSTRQLEELIRCESRGFKPGEPPALIPEALDRITRERSFFPQRELVRRTAEAAQGKGANVEQVLEAVRRGLSSPDLVFIGQHAGERVFTTREMLALERELLATVTVSRHNETHVVPDRERVSLGACNLSPEQQKAVEHITRRAGSIQVVSGLAGTGKSTMLASARKLWEDAGFRVIGAALSGKAARGLEENAGIQSVTIARLLRDTERLSRQPDLSQEFFHHGSRCIAHLDRKTVLVIDEAAMVGTRQMKALVDAAQGAGAKLVLVGDAKQLQPIEAGGPFQSIGQFLGEATLTDIRRQTEPWAREAVRQLAEGNAPYSLEAYASRGLVSVAKDREEAKTVLLREWAKAGVSRPSENLIISSENADAQRLNRSAQDERIKVRALGPESLKVGEDFLHVHDRVLFTRNSRLYGVRNGCLGTVQAVYPRRLKIAIDGGGQVTIPVRHYPHLRLGYAVTTHKAQGMTAENTFILAGGPMQDKELSYVQVSRARSKTKLFIDAAGAGEQLTELARQMARSHQKFLAIDIAAEPARTVSRER